MQVYVTTRSLTHYIWLSLLLAILAGQASAQSTDVAWPTPVRSNEVNTTIPARDIGDPRVTDHFYAFSATPGDLLITVDSRNFNGDVDVFTLSGLRPLLKFTVYAGSSASLITKSLYLRQPEDLLLRVEGRTPNDDEAVYRIRFGGSFQAITSGPLVEHDDAAQAAMAESGSGQKGRRVTSAGARIAEPPSEVAAAPTPEPTPETPSLPEPKAVAKPTARTTRPRRPTPRRTRPAAAPKSGETAKAEDNNKPPAESSETEAPKTTTRTARRTRGAKAAAKPPVVQEPEDSGPRLVIETDDGTLVDRYMSSVRRVTVENGQVVVIGRDGKIQRIPLASVVRMTISP